MLKTSAVALMALAMSVGFGTRERDPRLHSVADRGEDVRLWYR
jgi:hypothetical protein